MQSALAPLFRFALLAFFLSLSGLFPLPASGQEAAPPEQGLEITPEELQGLITTLEDPLAREVFLERLRTLAAVRQEAAEEAEEEDLGVSLLAAASLGIAELSEQLDVIAAYLQEAPALVEGIMAALLRPDIQRLVLEIAGKVAGIFIAALLVAFVARGLLARPWRLLQARQAHSPFGKGILLLAALLLKLIPLAVFAGAAYLVLPLLDPRPITRLVLLTLVNAHLIAQGLITTARTLLAVDSPGLRPYPMKDESAAYWYVWIRRLAIIVVYGYFINEAVLLVGLERTLHAAIVDLTGLFVALLLVSLVLQNRTAVSTSIRGGPEVSGVMTQVRGSLAALWHLLAIAYVIGVYIVWAFEVEGGFAYLLRSTVATVVILVLLRLVVLAIERGVNRLFHIPENMREQYTGLEARADRYRPLISKGLKALILIAGAMALLEAWGVDATAFLATELGRELVTRLARLAFIIGFSVLLWELVSALIEKRLKSQVHSSRRILTLLPLLKNVVRLVILVLGSMIALAEIGVNIGPLLASAGVIGLAIGFGAQTLVRDLITGFFVVLEDIIAVGDWVEVGTHAGMVESMTIRTLRLRDLSGNLRIIPFGDVSSVHKVANDFSFAVIVVGVAYRENTDEVIELLKQVGQGMQQDPEWSWRILEPLEIHGVTQFAASSVDIRARFKCRPLEQWGVQREFLRRIKLLFDEKGVEIPFPHQTVYFGEDRSRHAPPARVVLEREPESEPSEERGLAREE